MEYISGILLGLLLYKYYVYIQLSEKSGNTAHHMWGGECNCPLPLSFLPPLLFYSTARFPYSPLRQVYDDHGLHLHLIVAVSEDQPTLQDLLRAVQAVRRGPGKAQVHRTQVPGTVTPQKY